VPIAQASVRKRRRRAWSLPEKSQYVATFDPKKRFDF